MLRCILPGKIGPSVDKSIFVVNPFNPSEQATEVKGVDASYKWYVTYAVFVCERGRTGEGSVVDESVVDNDSVVNDDCANEVGKGTVWYLDEVVISRRGAIELAVD